MTVFFNNTDFRRQFDAMAQGAPTVTAPIEEPGFFDNALSATATAPLRAEAQIGQLLLGTVGDVGASWFDDAFDTTAGSDLVAKRKKEFADFSSAMEPDARTTGTLGQVMHGVGTVLTQAATGGGVLGAAGRTAAVAGASTTVGATQGYTENLRLQEQGVDPTTAAIGGTVTGLSQGVGVLLPAAIPGKLLTRIASGAALNVGAGMAERGGMSAVLENAGYNDMAAQYRVFDGVNIAIDAVLGGTFGALHRGAKQPEPVPGQTGETQETPATPPLRDDEPSQGEVDIMFALNNWKQLEVDAAPGLPANTATRNAHVQAMDIAREQLFRGGPVDVSTAFSTPERTQFVVKQQAPVDNGRRQAKLAEVERKQAEATAQAESYRTELQAVEAALNYTPSKLETLAQADPETAQRLTAIEQELQAVGLTKKRRLELEKERTLIDTKQGIPVKEIRQAQTESKAQLERQREAITQKLEVVEKKAARYLGEAEARRTKLEVSSQPPETPISGDMKPVFDAIRARKAREDALDAEMEQARKLGVFMSEPQAAKGSPSSGEGFPASTGEARPQSERLLPASDNAPEERLATITPVLQEIATTTPDAIIPLVAEDGTVTEHNVREILAEVDAEIADAAETGRLMDVAANCFIRNGQ